MTSCENDLYVQCIGHMWKLVHSHSSRGVIIQCGLRPEKICKELGEATKIVWQSFIPWELKGLFLLLNETSLLKHNKITFWLDWITQSSYLAIHHYHLQIMLAF